MARVGTLLLTTALVVLGVSVSGSCRSEQESACYAPDQNLAHAYDEGRRGCRCAEDDADQCIDGVALICEAGRWQAVIDGPCFPEPEVGERCGDGFCSKYGTCAPQSDGSEHCVSTLGNYDAAAGASQDATETTSEVDPSIVYDAAADASADATEARSDAAPSIVYAPPPTSSLGPREACDPSSCTPYAYCDRSREGGAACRAKRNTGSPCTEARMCASGTCSAGQCVAGPAHTKGCVGTWDCAESIARVICGNRDCEVCVQEVTAQGEPHLWGALEDASTCDCPEPHSPIP